MQKVSPSLSFVTLIRIMPVSAFIVATTLAFATFALAACAFFTLVGVMRVSPFIVATAFAFAAFAFAAFAFAACTFTSTEQVAR